MQLLQVANMFEFKACIDACCTREGWKERRERRGDHGMMMGYDLTPTTTTTTTTTIPCSYHPSLPPPTYLSTLYIPHHH